MVKHLLAPQLENLPMHLVLSEHVKIVHNIHKTKHVYWHSDINQQIEKEEKGKGEINKLFNG